MPWANVTGRPTALSQFTNDSGFITSSGNAATASVATALAKDGDTAHPMTFHWNGQGGQPTWVWGGEDASNVYVYNPSNFTVYNSAHAVRDQNGNVINSTYATKTEVDKKLGKNGGTLTGTLIAQDVPIFGHINNGSRAAFVCSRLQGYDAGIGENGEDFTTYFGSVENFSTGKWITPHYTTKWKFQGEVIADTLSGSLAWGNVSGRPTALSQFTNDSGFITSSGHCASATTATTAYIVQENPSTDDVEIKNTGDGYINIRASSTNGYSGIVFHDGDGNYVSLQDILDYIAY
jgi:hypothetical protein